MSATPRHAAAAAASGGSSTPAAAPAPAAAAAAAAPKKLAGAEFVYRPRFKNDLPPLPFDPKSLKYDLHHFADDLNVRYQLSSLEKTQPYHLPVPDLPIDLIQLGLFDAEEYAFELPDILKQGHMQDPLDADLFVNPDAVLSGAIKSEQHIKLRLPTGAVPTASDAIDDPFSSSSQSLLSQSQSSSSRLPGDPRGSASPNRWTSRMRRLTTKDADDQVAVIQSTFDAAAARLKASKRTGLHHPTKPGVVATRILPLVPSLRLFANAYAHVDLPPTAAGSAAARAARARSTSPDRRDPLPRGAVLRTAEVPQHNMDAHALQMFSVHVPKDAADGGPMDPLAMRVADPDDDPEAAEARAYVHAGTYTFSVKAKESYTAADTLLHLAVRVPRGPAALSAAAAASGDGAPVLAMALEDQTAAEYVPIKSRIEMKRARVMKPGAEDHEYEAAVHAGGGIPVAHALGGALVYMVPVGDASVSGKAMAYANGLGLDFDEAEKLAAAGIRDWVEADVPQAPPSPSTSATLQGPPVARLGQQGQEEQDEEDAMFGGDDM